MSGKSLRVWEAFQNMCSDHCHRRELLNAFCRNLHHNAIDYCLKGFSPPFFSKQQAAKICFFIFYDIHKYLMWTEYDWRKLLLWVWHTMSSLSNFFLSWWVRWMEKGNTLDLWRLYMQGCILITKTSVSVQFCCRSWNKVRGKMWSNGFLRNRWKLERKWNLEFCESVCLMRMLFMRPREEVRELVVMFLHNWDQIVHVL